MNASGDPGERPDGVPWIGPDTPPSPLFAEPTPGALAALVQALEDECLLLRGRIAETERSNADLEAFAGRAAHELRNALAPVRLACRVLTGPSAADVAPVAEAMERSLHRALSLLDALLVFSRVGAVGAPGESRLDAALAAVLDELGSAIRAADIEVSCRDLDDRWVACEPGLLHIVLTNVIGNAVKFLARREVRWIRVTADDDVDGVRISVEDSGPGIPTHALDRVFEPFFRVPCAGTDGHGLGLATVRRIVGARRGRVGITSAPGDGTTVTITLPGRRSLRPPGP